MLIVFNGEPKLNAGLLVALDGGGGDVEARLHARPLSPTQRWNDLLAF